jgi:hypothetical protein
MTSSTVSVTTLSPCIELSTEMEGDEVVQGLLRKALKHVHCGGASACLV